MHLAPRGGAPSYGGQAPILHCRWWFKQGVGCWWGLYTYGSHYGLECPWGQKGAAASTRVNATKSDWGCEMWGLSCVCAGPGQETVGMRCIPPVVHHSTWQQKGVGRRPHIYLASAGRAFGYSCPWGQRGCGRFVQLLPAGWPMMLAVAEMGGRLGSR